MKFSFIFPTISSQMVKLNYVCSTSAAFNYLRHFTGPKVDRSFFLPPKSSFTLANRPFCFSSAEGALWALSWIRNVCILFSRGRSSSSRTGFVQALLQLHLFLSNWSRDSWVWISSWLKPIVRLSWSCLQSPSWEMTVDNR